jgi:hypothetical protein
MLHLSVSYRWNNETNKGRNKVTGSSELLDGIEELSRWGIGDRDLGVVDSKLVEHIHPLRLLLALEIEHKNYQGVWALGQSLVRILVDFVLHTSPIITNVNTRQFDCLCFYMYDHQQHTTSGKPLASTNSARTAASRGNSVKSAGVLSNERKTLIDGTEAP